jgi:hypothetical protein
MRWQTRCFKRTFNLTGRHDEADGSFLRDNANAPEIFNGYFYKCSSIDKYIIFSII